eukprot:1142166-Pelagomonas_calceolata.AAC.2
MSAVHSRAVHLLAAAPHGPTPDSRSESLCQPHLTSPVTSLLSHVHAVHGRAVHASAAAPHGAAPGSRSGSEPGQQLQEWGLLLHQPGPPPHASPHSLFPGSRCCGLAAETVRHETCMKGQGRVPKRVATEEHVPNLYVHALGCVTGCGVHMPKEHMCPLRGVCMCQSQTGAEGARTHMYFTGAWGTWMDNCIKGPVFWAGMPGTWNLCLTAMCR